MDQPTLIQTATRLWRFACRRDAPMRIAGRRQVCCLTGVLVILSLTLVACGANSAEELTGATATPSAPSPTPTAEATAIWTTDNGPESSGFGAHPTELAAEEIELSVNQGGGAYTYEQVSQATGSEADIDVMRLVRSRYESMQSTGINTSAIQFQMVSWGDGNDFRWDVIPVDGNGNLQFWLQFEDETTGEWRWTEQPGFDSLMGDSTQVRWGRLEGGNWRVGLEQVSGTFLVPVQVENGAAVGWLNTQTGEFMSFAVEEVAATVAQTVEPTVVPTVPPTEMPEATATPEVSELDLLKEQIDSQVSVSCVDASEGGNASLAAESGENAANLNQVCFQQAGAEFVINPEHGGYHMLSLLAFINEKTLEVFETAEDIPEGLAALSKYYGMSRDEMVAQFAAVGYVAYLPVFTEKDAQGYLTLEAQAFPLSRISYEPEFGYTEDDYERDTVVLDQGVLSGVLFGAGFWFDGEVLHLATTGFDTPMQSPLGVDILRSAWRSHIWRLRFGALAGGRIHEGDVAHPLGRISLEEAEWLKDQMTDLRFVIRASN